MSTLAGRNALVTGAGIGIGLGIALELARQGAAVALHYAHSAQGAQKAVDEIVQAGGKALAVTGNLSDVTTCRWVVDEAVEALGGLDILVNNAGVTREISFQSTTEDIYNEVFDLNMRGYFFCAQQAVWHMRQRRRGVIVNITSVHGYGGSPNHSAYAASKGAIIAFTRQLAIELASQHIRVNAVGPGVIEVPRYFDKPGYTSSEGDRSVPWGRVGKATDVAQAVAFLVSDAADFITGQTLYVDGGTTAHMGFSQ